MLDLGLKENDVKERVGEFFKKYPRSSIYEVQETHNGLFIVRYDRYNRQIADNQCSLGV